MHVYTHTQYVSQRLVCLRPAGMRCRSQRLE
jgi:hypothetical protein